MQPAKFKPMNKGSAFVVLDRSATNFDQPME